ncbi:hypothetical protein G9A89_004066 [Geosiphon pyriformis]|nr:hypothetical protein G9A89_004066 [Geosiphon pyriformis]
MYIHTNHYSSNYKLFSQTTSCIYHRGSFYDSIFSAINPYNKCQKFRRNLADKTAPTTTAVNNEKPILRVGEHDVSLIVEDKKIEAGKQNEIEELKEEEGFKGYKRSVQYKLKDKARNFLDFVRIRVQGGRGGDGCVAFHRDRMMPKGPPSGGNGGRGGHVTFVTSAGYTSLHYLPRNVIAGDGNHGKGELKHGGNGEDILLPIPLGTVIREVEPPVKSKNNTEDEDGKAKSDEYDAEAALAKRRAETWVHYPRYQEKNLLGSFFRDAEKATLQEQRYQRRQLRLQAAKKIDLDLSQENEEHLIVKGGLGGKGNPHFLTTANRSPKFATRGQEGATRYLELELKAIADAGLVGLPNAGKSTFLTAVSNAHPKIAPYPFTTLNPFIGTVDYYDKYQLTVADIPGLIKGAHKNIGLGHSFLRHVERSKVLVYVIDLASPAPWEDFNVLRNELEQYRKGLTLRPSMIIANKADVTEVAKHNLPILEEKFKLTNQPVDGTHKQELVIIPISAKYRKNINKVTSILRDMVEKIKREEKIKIKINGDNIDGIQGVDVNESLEKKKNVDVNHNVVVVVKDDEKTFKV